MVPSGHELGHNLGCNHDRDVEDDDDHPYAYGQRHCTGDKPYVTIMAYQDDCDVDYINYYSNPDVVVLGKPTGTAIENCARRIRDTMVRAVVASRVLLVSPRLPQQPTTLSFARSAVLAERREMARCILALAKEPPALSPGT